MPIASMTGFARARGQAGDAAFAWEVKSVNGRGFDLRLRVPQGFEAIEAQARDILSKLVSRGNVQATLTVDRPARPVEVRVNGEVLEKLLTAGLGVSARTGAAPPTVDGLLMVRGVVEVIETPESEEERTVLHRAVLDGLSEAGAMLIAARRSEGAALAALIEGHLETIGSSTARAEALPARQPAVIKAKLAEQLRLLLDAQPALDPDRLHQEAMLLAAKVDVREEIDRLKAHVAHARKLAAEGGPIGRKLDFLAQEFNREANTLCSKSNDRELTEIGLSLKTTIDQLREQIQNVE